MNAVHNLYNELYCLFKGHIRIRKTVELPDTIHKFSCERCGCAMDMGIWKTIPPPPGVDIAEWEIYRKEVIDNYLNR